jgi:YD repeat-containing protein
MKKISIISILLLNVLLAFSQVTYQYDNLYRLQQVNYPNGATVVYTYDALGNRLTKTVTNGNTTVAVTGVSLNKSATTLSVNQAEQLTATVLPSNATNQQVAWTSSNESIAVVSGIGIVTAKQAGKATITVTTADGNKKATCEVTVLPLLGIEDINISEIKLYPNPAKDFLTLKNAEGKDIIVYTSLGNKIFEKANVSDEEIINTSSWSSGVYLVKINDKKEPDVVIKLVKE